MKKERIDVLLVRKGLVETRQRGQSEILAGNVFVDDTPVEKSGAMVNPDADIRLKEKFPYVSRGALKLIHALDYFQCDVSGKAAIDVGSSTGGFTQVLLERGARLIYAVDSGTNQLDWKLRTDPRVHVMEKTNARYLKPGLFDPLPEIAVMDVSFISITKILEPLAQVLRDGFFIIALIKPQFELSPSKIGAKGLVKEEYHSEAISKVIEYAQSIGLAASTVIPSPITGAKSGNIEFLVCLKKKDLLI
jgi:23S rRNA (cytidine1920-2'-O)/16S rRNA (cytidine1409-2'-O)-methyltransferase